MSSPTEVQAADERAPSGASAPTAAQHLTATGTVEAHNATGLTVGAFATLRNGSAAIRLRFADQAGLEDGAVDATALMLEAHAVVRWLVSDRDAYVYAESSDGGETTFEAWVWTSSGPRSAS